MDNPLTSQLCSRCGEDGMNCKCETFHPNLINIKPRLVKCPPCKVEEIREGPVPRCKLCGELMFNVIKSPLV